MRRSIVVAVCVVVVAAIALAGAGAYVIQRQRQTDLALAAERQKEAALQAQAQSRAAADALQHLEDRRSAETALTTTITKEATAFLNDRDVASKLSKERHDETVAGTMTLSDALNHATQEQSDVEKMRDDIQALADSSNSVASLFENLYGVDAVRSFRSDVQELLTQRQLYLNNWDRAAGDVVDFYKQQQSGRDPGSTANAEAFYQQSDDDWTRSLSIVRKVGDERDALEKRLSNDIANAKKRSAALAAQAPAK